jgi:hypothetical protein
MKYYINHDNIDFVYPRFGYTLATTVTCVPPADDVYFTEADAIVWYFGDGEKKTTTFAEGLSTTHTYKLPGTYILSAIAYTDYPNPIQNETAVATISCKIVNFIDNAITFVIVPPPTLPGYFTQYPYKVLCSFSDLESTPKIDLYSQFSRSYPPPDVPNKWSFVRPEWRFTDLSGRPITSIVPETTTIKINSKGEFDDTGTAVGKIGVAEFYFVDDIYSVDLFLHDAPSPIVWATIQTSAINYYKDSDIKTNDIYGYGTTEVRAYAPHVSYWRAPDYLKITENGVRDFVNPRWTTASIPFFISAQIDPTQVKKISQYRPDITFTKFIPYAVSAQGMDYVECAEDIPVYVTVNGSTSATFYNEKTPAAVNNLGTYTFNQTDKYGFVAPGFTKDEVKIYDEGNMQLSAAAVIDFNKLNLPVDALIYNPYVWIPNPAAGTITMVYYTGGLNEHFTRALKNQFNTHSRKNIFTPVVTNLTTTSTGLTGEYNGVYAVAVSPGNEPDFEYYTWVADADVDVLYKYDTLTNMVLSADLKAVTNLSKVSPANICLDHNKELWVTCYDTLSVLKFDANGNLLFGVDVSAHIPLTDPGMPGMFDISPATSIFDDVMVLEPTCIDTDTQNNIWVSYSNPVSSYLIKYSSTGSYITSIPLPINSTPQDILIDKDDSFWSAQCFEIYDGVGSLKKYDTLGNQLSSFDNIPNLGYLTYDVDGNPWFTYEYNKIGKIKNGNFTHVATVSSSYPHTNLNIPPQKGPSGYIEMTALEGIACTHKNLIFVVHSIDNKIYIYNAKNDKLVDTISIKPDLMLGIYNDPKSFAHHEEQWQKSIEVIGDWTGIRWSRKYKSFYFETKTITGTSKILNVTKLNQQEIRKKNQNFNMSEQLASFALSPALRDNDFLFNTFLPSIYGTSKNIDDIGTAFYEKIANFLANHNDIDTCEIDNVYKLADMLDIAVDDYRLSFPFQIEQVVNMMTIAHSKLWGTQKIYDTDPIKTRGDKLNYNTYSVTEGVPIIIYDKPNNNFTYFYPPSVENQKTYSLSQLTAIGLVEPIEANYEFYSYKPYIDSNFYGGVIDWDNPYTTLNSSLSTYEDWVKDAGIIDNILNFYLYKGLKLI